MSFTKDPQLHQPVATVIYREYILTKQQWATMTFWVVTVEAVGIIPQQQSQHCYSWALCPLHVRTARGRMEVVPLSSLVEEPLSSRVSRWSTREVAQKASMREQEGVQRAGVEMRYNIRGRWQVGASLRVLLWRWVRRQGSQRAREDVSHPWVGQQQQWKRVISIKK